MSHRNELFQMDILHFRIGKEASYLFVLLDDYSRFVPGWGLYREATSSNAIEIVNKAIAEWEASRKYQEEHPEEVICGSISNYLLCLGLNSRFGRGHFERRITEDMDKDDPLKDSPGR